MTRISALLILSLGLISTNAFSNDGATQTVPGNFAFFDLQVATITCLILAALTFVLFVVSTKRKREIRSLSEQVKRLESNREQLEQNLAERSLALSQAEESLKAATEAAEKFSTAGGGNALQPSGPNHSFDEALIDISVGLKKVRGKEDRYQSLLNEFISKQPNLVTKLTEHVGKSEMLQAKEFTREMKEATGDLALDSLHFCLEDLENAFIDDDLAATHQKLVDLGRAWRITEREVQKYLQRQSA